MAKHAAIWPGLGLGARTSGLRKSLLRSLGSRAGPLSRRLRHPKPWLVPAARKQLNVARAGAMGDVLMCTPALRELKRVNPACRVRLFTRYSSLVNDLPYIDDVADFDGPRPDDLVMMSYEDVLPPRSHISRILGDCLGVRVTDIRPDCVVRAELVRAFTERWRNYPKPHIVVNRRAGPWTPNKDWADSSWCELVKILQGWATVIEIGAGSSSIGDDSERYVDLRGRTTIDELVAALAAADLHIGPISGPVHVAAAVGTPAVVIYGGYEHPVCSSYPWNTALYTPIECSPCWLREPCPIGQECLRVISASKVALAAYKLWDWPKLHPNIG